MLERAKQVFNLIRDEKWVCFLVGEIVDKVPHGYSYVDIKDTDLCKKLLNAFRVQRETVPGLSSVLSIENEFISYIKEYGVAKTVLKVQHLQSSKYRTIAIAGENIVGIECLNKVFFLPFHTVKRETNTSTSIVRTVTQAILDYRQKRIVEIPDWVNEFQFSSEENVRSKISLLLDQTNKLQSQLSSWRGYKAILTTSGDILKDRIIKILKDFFQLKIDPIDNNREDAKIIDEDGKVLVLIEVKGTKTGVRREYINQVDSHRERNELPVSFPGVLFINNEMSITGIQKRLETKVPDEHIKHAKNSNTLIVRTIDLLFFMRHFENKPDRKDKLINLLLSGGGWLKADSECYEVIQK